MAVDLGWMAPPCSETVYCWMQEENNRGRALAFMLCIWIWTNKRDQTAGKSARKNKNTGIWILYFYFLFLLCFEISDSTALKKSCRTILNGEGQTSVEPTSHYTGISCRYIASLTCWNSPAMAGWWQASGIGPCMTMEVGSWWESVGSLDCCSRRMPPTVAKSYAFKNMV